MRIRSSLLVALLFFALSFRLSIQSAESADALDSPLPLDPNITLGTLKNGLTYYIRENRKPENRARFRLVINAGSMQESDSQKGIAHFLEHMAFNGTANFEKQELVNFFERIGMRFGADLNAYTSFDETVYMLEIPMDDEEILETAFRVLRDWIGGIAFEPEEIEKERGVVIEEWRLGRGALARLADKQYPVLFHKSRYASRLPIGEVEIIRNAPREVFVDFYEKWYRPNLMAIIAVGDFQKEQIEARIQNHFSDFKNPNDAPDRIDYPVPDHDETLFSIETDPELRYSQIQIAYKRPPTKQGTAAAYRASIVEQLYAGMLNRRLAERVQEANPPYLYGAVAKVAIVRSKDVIIQTAIVKENEFEEGLNALLMETQRAQRDGFTESELSRIQADIMRSMERAFAEREKTNSSSYTAEYTRHFLQQEPIPGIAVELSLYKKFLPEINLDEVNRVAADWMTPHNRIILFSAPKKEGLKIPSREDILRILQNADSLEIPAYDDGDLAAALISKMPSKGSVIEESHRDDLGLTEWKLSNGIRVLLKKTDFKKDQILMRASSPGGDSQFGNDHYESTQMAVSLVTQSGLGSFDLIGLNKKLSGKLVSVQPFINERFEGFRGSSSTKDLETLLQLIHLYFTAPRADEKAFASLLAQYKIFIANRLNDPQAVFADAMENALYGDHPRHLPLNEDFLNRVDLKQSFDVYADRFADASDFTFALVGAMDLKTIQPLVENYLGSLPNASRTETAKDIDAQRASGRVHIEVRKGLEEKSTVRILFHGEADWSPEERFALHSTIEVLKIRLREILREDKGGVYGVSVSGGLSRLPRGHFASNIRFGCNPENVEDLIAATLSEIDRLKREGPSEDNLGKIRETHLRIYERGMKENAFWISNLMDAVQNDLDASRILSYPDRVAALTKKTIQEAAQRYFDQTNLFTAVLFPEEKTKDKQLPQVSSDAGLDDD